MAQTRRDSMIAAAADLLDRGGPAAVTLREVGRATGVSHNAPYKHFTNKHDLLAAIASRELARHSRAMHVGPHASPPMSAESLMIGYVHWAQRYPERFKLTFGRWTRDNPELGAAAKRSREGLIRAVEAAQRDRQLPAGNAERLAYLLLASAHGAADLALAGHLAADGKGRADAQDLVADLFGYLRLCARRPK